MTAGPRPRVSRETLRNLREISPTVYFNVPKGFEMLAPHLRRTRSYARTFYRRLRAYFFAGASLAQHTWDELDAASTQELGFKVPMLSGLGATETGPSVTFTTPAMGRSGVIGLPAAGTLVKLAPVEEKLEIRVRGPCGDDRILAPARADRAGIRCGRLLSARRRGEAHRSRRSRAAA